MVHTLYLSNLSRTAKLPIKLELQVIKAGERAANTAGIFSKFKR